MIKENILNHFEDINHLYNNCFTYEYLSHMLDEMERTVVIDGVEYVAESPSVKTIAKDGEVCLSGFYKKEE